MGTTLREIRAIEEEIVRVDELLTIAYGTASRRPDLDLYLAARPSRWCVIEHDGELQAVAGCLAYGGFSWLGLVATHPDARGRGLASQLSAHLVEWSHAQGCRTVALDASLVGRPVYERLGFVQVGATAELLRPAGSPVPEGALAHEAARPELPELVMFDREAFGGDRSALLCGLAGDPRGRWLVTRTPDGSLGGYLLVREQVVGPGAAVDEPAARRLIRAALDPAREQRLLVADESMFLQSLLALGFVEQRRLTHMRLGALELAPTRSRLLAQLSYATG